MSHKFKFVSTIMLMAVVGGGILIFPQTSIGAATIEAFDVSPKQISGLSTLNYNYRIKSDRDICGGGPLYWSIERATPSIPPDSKVIKSGEWSADSFLLDNGVKTGQGTFRFSLWSGLTSEPLSLVLGCGRPLQGQPALKTKSEPPITINSSASPTGRVSVNFGATPIQVAPNTATNFQFTLRLTAKRSDLDCREGAPVVWGVYKFPQTAADDFSDSALVERGALAVSDFGVSSTTVDKSFSKSVTTPNASFNFKARVTCDRAFGFDELTKSGAVSVTVSGAAGGTCNNNGKCDSSENNASCPNDCPLKPGQTQTFLFKLENPLQATNLVDLIDVIATWLFNIAIPITVAMIVYAGVIFLISRGDTTKVTQARKILLYAVVGFTIILIGKGFITLVESILNLGTTP